MTQVPNQNTDCEDRRIQSRQSIEYNRTLSQLETLRTRTQFTSMKLTPWKNIWASLAAARLRGNGRMVEVFYDTLFNEAVFDDRGAWCFDTIKPR
jgi:hypothetical protein